MTGAPCPQRMRFIADLFRLEHESAALFRPPFTLEQLGSIAAGRIPDGTLSASARRRPPRMSYDLAHSQGGVR